MPDDDEWIAWSPPNFPAVTGRYTRRRYDAEEKKFEPQLVTAKCATCGAEMRRSCDRGKVREWIAKFGAVHAHRDPLGG